MWLLPTIANWKVFEKMGKQGWKALIPIYNTYVLFEILYGDGCRMFLQLIPFYGIYISVKAKFDLAKAFNKGVGFGFGLWLLNSIFICILAFGKAIFKDGSLAVEGTNAQEGSCAVDMLMKLNELRENGILTEEEYQQKKDKYLKMI